ncbi:hypothetical protein PR048_005259 [Dryococelus australis]|uniref:Uncharacterized protein n=1 Tax=Dryococelus australis TaxID=614101 RepID=A0ABQ9I7P0_9NEOP|nr:hypothetical protein PR048_005259 [Dryococelus australis]
MPDQSMQHFVKQILGIVNVLGYPCEEDYFAQIIFIRKVERTFRDCAVDVALSEGKPIEKEKMLHKSAKSCR